MKLIHETKEFEPESYEVFQEIVSRWGQADYENDIKRKEHQDTLKLEWNTYGYARNRVAEYPSIGDQLDMIYKDMKNGTTTHAEVVEAVKNKYKKG